MIHRTLKIHNPWTSILQNAHPGIVTPAYSDQGSRSATHTSFSALALGIPHLGALRHNQFLLPIPPIELPDRIKLR